VAAVVVQLILPQLLQLSDRCQFRSTLFTGALVVNTQQGLLTGLRGDAMSRCPSHAN
jgi:hypothetical protein